MATIAWYGAGMMGAGFVEALRRRNEEVVVWNRTFEKAKALERFGAVAVSDPRAAAKGASQIHIMLSDDASVDALLDELEGAIDASTVVVDHTTVAPAPNSVPTDPHSSPFSRIGAHNAPTMLNWAWS